MTVQQQFNNATTLQVGYVGQRGTHLMVPTWLLQGDLQPNGTITRVRTLPETPVVRRRSHVPKDTFPMER